MAGSPRYGRAHQRLRAQWALLVAEGGVQCWRCGHVIDPRKGWDLGHDDHDPTYYRGPEHQRCNRGAPHLSADPEPRVHAWWNSDHSVT